MINMTRIIFFRHLSYTWDNGKHMVKYDDFKTMAVLGQTLNIDVIVHSPRMCDKITASALAQGCGCNLLACDERLSGSHRLPPSRFIEDLTRNAVANHCDTVAVIAGREPLELLNCPPLQHGEFYIRRETPVSNLALSRGSIADFRNLSQFDIRPAADIINYLY